MRYRLTESVITIAGTVELLKDEYDGNVERVVDTSKAATVSVGVRGDPTGEAGREVNFGRGGADDDFTIETAADGRLSGVSYKSLGVGSQVMIAGAKILAFVGGIATAIAKLAVLGDDGAPPSDPKQAEKDARKKWDNDHKTEAELYTSSAELLVSTERALILAQAAVATSDAKASTAALALSSRLQQVISDLTKELGRIDGLYKAWRATTQQRRTAAFTYEIALSELPADSGGRPDVGALTGLSKEAWEHLGVLVTIGEPSAGSASGPRRDYFDVPQEGAIYWRWPRVIRLWVWRRGANDEPMLDRTMPALVVDEKSGLGHVQLDSSLFGERAGSLTFGDLGTPTKITSSDKSAVGSFATALSELPEAVTTGLESAAKAQTTFHGILDADDERRLAALKRRADIVNKELELRGLAATSDLFAEQKRLEQLVAIAESNEKLEPESQLELLKQQFELEQTQAKLDELRRQASIDAELASTRSEIARLEERLKLLELKK